VVEEGHDLDQLQPQSVFTTGGSLAAGESRLPATMQESRSPISIAEGRLPISKMLDEFDVPEPAEPQREKAPLVPARVVAFGAQ
jgi:hypothetical protein